jgi:HK97 family phage major capsid protein
LKSGSLIVVAKESGQAADTIVAENVINMRARCWGYRRAVWIANPDAVPQLMKLVIVAGTGGTQIPVWRPGNDENGVPDMLLGRPLYYSERCSALGDEGDIVLANWSQYLDGQYRPMDGVSSIHVRWQANESAFRFILRNDGSPWWRSPLTPRRSSVTLSPFVTLAAR